MSNKKLECWANEYSGSNTFWHSEEGAKRGQHNGVKRVAVHLREVPTPEEIERFRSVITNDGLVFKSDYDALLRAYVGEVE